MSNERKYHLNSEQHKAVNLRKETKGKWKRCKNITRRGQGNKLHKMWCLDCQRNEILKMLFV